MSETCRFCGTVESAGNPNCLSYKQAIEITDVHPHGCPWFDRESRDRFAAPGAGGWMPIETAPQDGTEVIGCYYRPGDEMFKPVWWGPWTMAFERGQWRSSWDRSEVVSYMSDFSTDYKDLDSDPTHWQPLPTLPGGALK